MTGLGMSLAEAREHVRRILDQQEAVRLQLVGLQLSLPEPPAERVRLEDVGDEMDAVTDLRTTIACILEDYIRPVLQDLQDFLPGSNGPKEEP
jgi:hypothetical protein